MKDLVIVPNFASQVPICLEGPENQVSEVTLLCLKFSTRNMLSFPTVVLHLCKEEVIKSIWSFINVLKMWSKLSHIRIASVVYVEIKFWETLFWLLDVVHEKPRKGREQNEDSWPTNSPLSPRQLLWMILVGFTSVICAEEMEPGESPQFTSCVTILGSANVFKPVYKTVFSHFI